MNVKNRRAESQEFFWRLLKVEEPPFAKGQWTHVAVTWDGPNNTQNGRARLYFNAAYQGATGVIREPFTWDASQATIRLGTGPAGIVLTRLPGLHVPSHWRERASYIAA